MGFMARDLWLRDGSRERVVAAAAGLRVEKRPPPHHLLPFLEAITCIYRWFFFPTVEDGEGALTDPLVHIAETSCALTVKERALRGKKKKTQRTRLKKKNKNIAPGHTFKACVVDFLRGNIDKSSGNSRAALQLLERKAGKVVTRVCDETTARRQRLFDRVFCSPKTLFLIHGCHARLSV